MSARTHLVLARHGRTVWHEENRYAGSSDVDLDDLGREQARQLAAWAVLSRPVSVVCSPLRRARETATPSAAALGQELVVVDALREVHFGVAEGQTLSELTERDAEMVALFRSDPVAHHFPDGEPSGTAAVRGARALQALAVLHPGQTVLVVAHNTLLRLALCELLGVAPARYRHLFPRLDNGALTTVSVASSGDESAALLALNVPLPPAPAALPAVPLAARAAVADGRLPAP